MEDELKEMQSISVVLTPAEALVLFDLLSRWAETDAASVLLEHQAEWRVLWDTLAVLQKALVEPFMPDYRDRLDRAREIVRNEEQ